LITFRDQEWRQEEEFPQPNNSPTTLWVAKENREFVLGFEESGIEERRRRRRREFRNPTTNKHFGYLVAKKGNGRRENGMCRSTSTKRSLYRTCSYSVWIMWSSLLLFSKASGTVSEKTRFSLYE
jgi:hypothetical protein